MWFERRRGRKSGHFWKDTTDIRDTKSKVTGAGFRERVRNACDVTLEVEPVPVESLFEFYGEMKREQLDIGSVSLDFRGKFGLEIKL